MTFTYLFALRTVGWVGCRGTKLITFLLTTEPFSVILIPMMNDLSDMIQVSVEETITLADEARMEHERGERERERAEVWDRLEAQFGPLHFRNGRFDYSDYDDLGWKD